MAQGPLSGVRVVEFAGLGPAPFCGMLLSDLGADVVRIDRKDARPAQAHHVTHRGRKSIALDLKNKDSIELCLQLFERRSIIACGSAPTRMPKIVVESCQHSKEYCVFVGEVAIKQPMAHARQCDDVGDARSIIADPTEHIFSSKEQPFARRLSFARWRQVLFSRHRDGFSARHSLSCFDA